LSCVLSRCVAPAGLGPCRGRPRAPAPPRGPGGRPGEFSGGRKLDTPAG